MTVFQLRDMLFSSWSEYMTRLYNNYITTCWSHYINIIHLHLIDQFQVPYWTISHFSIKILRSLLSLGISLPSDNTIIRDSSSMKERSKQPSPPKIKYQDVELMSSQQKYEYLLTQLAERNNINDDIIKKYVQRCNKKYHKQLLIRTNSTILETSKEQIALKEEQQHSGKLLPSKTRFHTEQLETSQPLFHSINRIKSIDNIDSCHQTTTERQTFVGKVSIMDDNIIGKNVNRSKTQNKVEASFKKYMKGIYLRESLERKGKQGCLQEHVKGHKMINRNTMDKSKLLNINVKSMVFGNQFVYNGQQNTAPSMEAIKPIHYNNCYEAFSAYKMANIFLPNITRQQNLNNRSFQRQKTLKPEKMMKVLQTQSSQRSVNTRIRALWISEGSHRVGSSFRVNTFQTKKPFS